MSLSFRTLASSSSGNCTLVLTTCGSEQTNLLLDAGISPRRTGHRLAEHGLGLADLDHILLTHVDSDHLHPGWINVAEKFNIPIHLHHRHQFKLNGKAHCKQVQPFEHGLQLSGNLTVESVPLPHDALGTVGFVLDCAGQRLGLATDLGRVTTGLLDAFVDLDSLAIESNYDRPMQLRSNRPGFLVGRIMNGKGHLSNEQSLDAVRHVSERSNLQHIVLLHLSRHCNDAAIVRRLWQTRAPHLSAQLTIADHRDPTPLLRIRSRRSPVIRTGKTWSGLQMNLFNTPAMAKG